MSGTEKKASDVAFNAWNNLDWEGMAKLLVSDEARKEFANIRRAFDDIISQLQTKFSQGGSNEGQAGGVQEGEQSGAQEKYDGERKSDVETLCADAILDNRFVQEVEATTTNNDGGRIEGDQHDKAQECLDNSEANDVYDIVPNEGEEMMVEDVDDAEQVSLGKGQEIEAEELDTDTEQATTTDDKSVKQAALNPGSSVKASDAAFKALKNIDWEGMAKLLVSDEAHKEFTNLRRAFDDINSQLQTKFSQVGSNEGQAGEVQEGEQSGAQEKYVGEQKSDTETICADTISDDHFVEEVETTVRKNDGGPIEGDQHDKAQEGLDNSAAHDVSDIVPNGGEEMMVENVDDAEQVRLGEGQEMEAEELDTDIEQPRTSDAILDNHFVEEVETTKTKNVGGPIEGDQHDKAQKGLDDSAAHDVCDIVPNEGEEMMVGNVDDAEQVRLGEGQETEEEEVDTDIERPRTTYAISHNHFVEEVETTKTKNGGGPIEGDQHDKAQEGLDYSAAHDVSDIVPNEGEEMMVEDVDDAEQVSLGEGQEIEAEELDTGIEQPTTTDDKPVKWAALNPGSSVKASDVAFKASKNIDWEGMTELLVSDEARKEFTNLCCAVDDVNSQLQTKFSQVGSNERQDGGVQEGEQSGSEEKYVGEQKSDTETICADVVEEVEATKSKNDGGPIEGDQHDKAQEGLDNSAAHDVSDIVPNEGEEMMVEDVDDAEQVSLGEGQEMEAELDANSEQPTTTDDKSVKLAALNPGSSVQGSDVAFKALKNIDLEGMAKLLVSDGACKQFANLRCAFDNVNSQLQTKFSQVGSNEGQAVGVQEGEQSGAKEKYVGEQKSDTETICVDTIDTISDNYFMEEVETTKTNNDGGPIEGDQHDKAEEGLDNSVAHVVSDIVPNEGEEMMVEDIDDAEQVSLGEGQEMEAEELDTDTEQPTTTDDRSIKRGALNPGSTVKAYQATYLLPLDDKGDYIVSDLVWGKVRSHPWWPGQIFDPLDASEKAMKYFKKDCYLVAYFGDRTFAWNDATLLKPFRSHFSQVEKQSNLEVFQNAVSCALEEVSRRVELGLACSCIPKNVFDKLKIQIVENTGIREESSTREDTDKSMGADSFHPGKLVEYLKELAQSPAGGANRLELVVAKSQLLAFYRLKGYSQLPEFQSCGEVLERTDALDFEDEDAQDASPVFIDDGQILSAQVNSQMQRSSYPKRKHNLKDSINFRKKEKTMSELMGDSWESFDDEFGLDGKADIKLSSPTSAKKRKGSDSFADESAVLEGRKTISVAKVSSTTASSPKMSFKIGDCIRRVASQMTGSPILKSNSQKLDGSSDGLIGDGSDVSFQYSEDVDVKRMIFPTEYSSLDDLLSQLHLAARDPLKGYSFFNVIISFFSDFRNSVTMEQHDKIGGKRRKVSVGGAPETFEFEDMSDTYWTDRVIQNGSEEQQPSRRGRKKDNQLVPVDPNKSFRKSNSRKRYSDGNYDQSVEKPASNVDEKAPAELVMHFPVVDSVPSEMKLNKMFRHFGPLKEAETEVDRDTNRARVIFKRGSDAQTAYGSVTKFNIFGSTLVNYQLNHTISVPFKSVPIVATQGMEDGTLFLSIEEIDLV